MKQLGTVTILGTKVEVVACTPEEVGDEVLMSDGVHATFVVETNTIRLNKASVTKDDLARAHTVHELTHAWLAHSGALYQLRTSVPNLSAEGFEVLEECLVRALAPAINSSLDDLARMFPRRGGK